MQEHLYYSMILKYSAGILFFFNGEGKILEANKEAAETLLYTDGLKGVCISEIFPHIFSDNNISNEIKAVLDLGNMQAFAYRSNHTCLPVSVRIGKADEEELYLCSVANNSDISMIRKELELMCEKASDAMNTRNEFMANITHELRTPVNGILGHIQNLLQEEPNDPSTVEVYEIIETCCHNMNKIINNILDFSKMDAGKFTIEEYPFTFRKMMKQVVDTNIVAINKKGLSFFINIADNIPQMLIGDELRIIQILNNLISNAVKFTHKGRISIEVTETWRSLDKIELFFMVIDTGIGIDANEKDKLFQSFSQVDASITRKYGGTGLGLAVCKQLVELMGGSVQVESEKNKGSNFSFSICLKPDQGQEESDNTLQLHPVFELPVGYAMMKSEEKKREINTLMENMILCIELESWEKAENFAEMLKPLLNDYGEELRKTNVKVGMAIRKKNHEKSIKAYYMMKELLNQL